MGGQIISGVFKVKIKQIIFQCPVNQLNNILELCKKHYIIFKGKIKLYLSN